MSEQQIAEASSYRKELESSIQNLNLLISKITNSLNTNEDEKVQIMATQIEDLYCGALYKNSAHANKPVLKLHRKDKLSTVVEESMTQEDALSPRVATVPFNNRNQYYSQNEGNTSQNQSIYREDNHESKLVCASLSKSKRSKGIKSVLSFDNHKKDLKIENGLDPMESMEKSLSNRTKHKSVTKIDVRALKSNDKRKPETDQLEIKSRKGLTLMTNYKIKNMNQTTKNSKTESSCDKTGINKTKQLNLVLRSKTKNSEDHKQNTEGKQKKKSNLSRQNLLKFYIEKRMKS